MTFKSYTDIPVNADPSSRFVPWIVTLMVYLATIALMIAFSMSTLIQHWDADLTSKLTVEIPSSRLLSSPVDERTTKLSEQVVQILLKTPGVGTVRTLPREEIIANLQPWFRQEIDLDLLPIPILLDVEISNRAHFNRQVLQKSLHAVDPNLILEDHLVWQKGVLNLVYSAQIVGLLIVFMIVLASISTIAFTSQTTLIIHRNIIEILYLMGATDAYIIRQFQNHAFKVGLKGGCAGFFLSLGTLVLLKFMLQQLEPSPLLTNFPIIILGGIALLVPVCVTLFMMIAARVAVRIALKYAI